MGILTTTGEAEALARVLGDATTPTPKRPSREQRIDQTRRVWSSWPMDLLERLPIPYWLVVVVAGMSAMAEQLFELSLSDPTFARADSLAGAGLVFPVLVIYILTHLRILKRASISALTDLRPSVHVSDQVYEGFARRLVRADWRVEVALLIASLSVVLFLFLGAGSDLLSYAGGLPTSPLAAGFVIFNYTLLGWLILSLVYCSIRHSLALRQLAHQPLEVNVFDPTNLLPFGRIALLQSLPTVALILIPLVLIGPPTQAGYIVILLSVVSVFSLFVPLWGVHQQIDRAKEEVLDNIYRRLLVIQEDLLCTDNLDAQTIDNMADRTTMLVKLRELIQQSPNWPFKDSAAVARAIVAVSSPLVYFILYELIGAFLIPTWTGGSP